MKFRLGLLTCVLLLLGVAAHGASGLFDQANRLYDSGKYKEALSAYESILSKGDSSANLYYNIGNTEYRLGERGKAIVNYERALALEPGHPEAKANLELARNQTGARVLARPAWAESLGFFRWSANTFSVVGLVSIWLIVFSIAGMMVLRLSESLAAWAVLVLSIAVAAYAGAGLWVDAQTRAVAVITGAEAIAHLAAAESAGQAGALATGTQVRVLGEHDQWVYCEMPGGARGWVRAGELEKINPA